MNTKEKEKGINRKLERAVLLLRRDQRKRHANVRPLCAYTASHIHFNGSISSCIGPLGRSSDCIISGY